MLRKGMNQAAAKSSSVLLPATMVLFAGALSAPILMVIGSYPNTVSRLPVKLDCYTE
jgi:hypothetical protein